MTKLSKQLDDQGALRAQTSMETPTFAPGPDFQQEPKMHVKTLQRLATFENSISYQSLNWANRRANKLNQARSPAKTATEDKKRKS